MNSVSKLRYNLENFKSRLHRLEREAKNHAKSKKDERWHDTTFFCYFITSKKSSDFNIAGTIQCQTRTMSIPRKTPVHLQIVKESQWWYAIVLF